jgi:hypothetical protein
MPAIAPLHAGEIGQPEYASLTSAVVWRVVGTLAPHVVMREAPQLVVHDRDERVACGRVRVRPVSQQPGHLLAPGFLF